MTDYAGEGFRISTRNEVDFDGASLTPAKVASVSVEVLNSDFSTVVVPLTAMTWNGTIGHWTFLWDTDDVEPGTYKAKVIIVGLDGSDSFEYHRIRLARDPHPDAS